MVGRPARKGIAVLLLALAVAGGCSSGIEATDGTEATDGIPVNERVTLEALALSRDGTFGLYTDPSTSGFPVPPLMRAPSPCDGTSTIYPLIRYEIALADRGKPALFDTGVAFDGRVEYAVEGPDGQWAIGTDCGDLTIVEPDAGTYRKIHSFDLASAYPPEANEPIKSINEQLEAALAEGANVATEDSEVVWQSSTSVEIIRRDWSTTPTAVTIVTLDLESPAISSAEPPPAGRLVHAYRTFAAPDDPLMFSTEPRPPIGRDGSFIPTVERGGEFVSAVNDDWYRDVGLLSSLAIGPDRSIAWITKPFGGFADLSVGRFEANGQLIDLHQLDMEEIHDESALRPTTVQFLPDGRLLILGSVGVDLDHAEVPAHAYHDLSTDLDFVLSHDPVPVVDKRSPLRDGLEILDPWYSGPSTSATPACGAETVYAEGPDGLYRLFPPDFASPPIVQVIHGEPRQRSDDDPMLERNSLLLAKCPGDDVGRVLAMRDDRHSRLTTSDAAVQELLAIDETEFGGVRALVRTTDGSEALLEVNRRPRDAGPLVEIPPELLNSDEPIHVPSATDFRDELEELRSVVVELLEDEGLAVVPDERNSIFGTDMTDDGFGVRIRVKIEKLPHMPVYRVEKDRPLVAFSGTSSNYRMRSAVSVRCAKYLFISLQDVWDEPGTEPIDPTGAEYEDYLGNLAKAVSRACATTS